MKDFIPLISVVIGGCLTSIGGFLSNYLLQRVTRSSDKRKYLREKLEEIYVLCDIVSQNNATKLKELTFSVENNVVIKNESSTQKPIQRLLMLLNIYFPHLKNKALALEKANENFIAIAINSCQEVMATGKQPQDVMKALINKSYYELELCCDLIKEKIRLEIYKIL